MPPKLKASSSKRKVDDRDTDNEEESQQSEARASTSASARSVKRTKTAEYVQNGQPKNKALPEKVEFEKKQEGTLRIVTWNVCGLAPCQKKARAV